MDSNVGIDIRSRIQKLADEVTRIHDVNLSDNVPSSIIISLKKDSFSIGGVKYHYDESGLRAAEEQAAVMRASIRERVEELAQEMVAADCSNSNVPTITIPASDKCDYFLIGEEKYLYDADGLCTAEKYAVVVATFMRVHSKLIRDFKDLRLLAAQAGMLIRFEGGNAIFYIPGSTGRPDGYPCSSEAKTCELGKFPITKRGLADAEAFLGESPV